jgi:hypothetical protein
MPPASSICTTRRSIATVNDLQRSRSPRGLGAEPATQSPQPHRLVILGVGKGAVVEAVVEVGQARRREVERVVGPRRRELLAPRAGDGKERDDRRGLGSLKSLVAGLVRAPEMNSHDLSLRIED